MTQPFTTEQISSLAEAYNSLEKIDPCTQHYQALVALLDRLPLHMLKQLSDANIRFVSVLASNRVRRRSNP